MYQYQFTINPHPVTIIINNRESFQPDIVSTDYHGVKERIE